MNVMVIFAAGVVAGWAADKLYQRFRAPKNQTDEEVEAVIVENQKTVELTGDDKTKSESVAKKEIKKEGEAKKEKVHRDDLSQLKGVGPKLAEALDEIGIYNYAQLSGSSVDMLLEQLRETGGRFTRSVISSIVDGAKQAVDEK